VLQITNVRATRNTPFNYLSLITRAHRYNVRVVVRMHLMSMVNPFQAVMFESLGRFVGARGK
jgi:hypothetical protein